MGVVGSSFFHIIKDVYNSPKRRASNRRFSIRSHERSPYRWQLHRLGRFLSIFSCTMVYIQQKEDPWNSVITGATTSGFLQMRQGLVKHRGLRCLVGCCLL
uniref:Uncharacterized protein n=1 Tax=Nelumbo nucifera TaxID=4432 RepID=A0A822Z851_NELNU|nr:TPA_asm: hypothetical protein HUJ06_000794 [Nelumbo nucifera]